MATTKKYKDGLTEKYTARMYDCEEFIYKIDDREGSFEENRAKIVAYLSSRNCGMSLGIELRRYMCKQYATVQKKRRNNKTVITGYTFILSDGREITVPYYGDEDYDIGGGDIGKYAEIFMDINKRFNTNAEGKLVSGINKTEAKRLLAVTEGVRRDKIFKICFALHMSEEDAYLFLTKYLCERTYNYRSPDEVIALYCFTHEEVNNYGEFLRIKAEYERRAAENSVSEKEKSGFTAYAEKELRKKVKDEEALYAFLLENRPNFNKFSQTALKEYKEMYETITDSPLVQNQPEELDEVGSREANREFVLRKPRSAEQVAKAMLSFIPRTTIEKVNPRTGAVTRSNDFVPIRNNGDNPTNDLPNAIISNPMLSDRINDLLNEKKEVERKDLVFMKFFLLSLEIDMSDDEEFSARCYNRFIDECNAMLRRCGYSDLSPFNKYENLILLSLASTHPFETFGMIIENSFFEYKE